MLTIPRAIVLGIVQGITELIPISSDGHLVLVPAWLGWDDLIRAGEHGQPSYLQFIVTTHVATALVLLFYFRSDWVRIIRGFLRTLRTRRITTPDERMGWLLAVASIPAAIAGVAFSGVFESVFASPVTVAALLSVNGCVLMGAEVLRRRRTETRRFETLNFGDAGVVGLAQVPALLGGISRSGMTISAGLLRGLDYRDAARFSFLMATPVIFGAGLYELPKTLGSRGGGAVMPSLVGAIFAAAAAYVAVRFMMQFLARTRLVPFGVYCVVIGVISIVRFI